MPIRVRLAALFALGTAVAVVVVSVVFVHFLAAGLRSSVDANLRSRADLLASTIDPNGPDTLVGTAATIHGQGEGFAQVLGPSGQVIAFSASAGSAPLINPAQLKRARSTTVWLSSVAGDARVQGSEAGDSPRAGEHIRLLAASVAGAGGARVVVVGSSLETTDAAIDRVSHAAAVGGVPAVLAAAAAAWLLASAALRPVERMRRQVADITAHNPDAGIEVPATRDEIAALARTMNDLLGRLGDALTRERGFVADAGHELRTPLAILRTELELASRPGRTQAELAAAVTAAAEETDRLGRLAEDLLLLAHSDPGETVRREPTNVHVLLSAAFDRARTAAAAAGITLVLDAPDDLDVEVDPDRIRQAVDNLIDNALRYTPAGTSIGITAGIDKATLVIAVSDSGPGFPPEFLPHAFERFRRADAARAPQDGGAGLGLAIVQSIAQAHGGRAVAENRPGGGAAVRLQLPVI
ncbi:MAG: two-component system, OmpR family, sensor kinase [Acidimicrobiaceae bacterium]|jgi:heavy metal sensor kinase|nr:two-component system, OmpR family, sensor kinase [Acidimicrobiaceae bacterium]